MLATIRRIFPRYVFLLFPDCLFISLQLPDSVKDFYRENFGVAPSADILAHLKRELMHAVWDLLLTPEFIHAYVNGLVVKCYDGVERLVFPRLFTYGADYPEKCGADSSRYDQIFRWLPVPALLYRESPDS
jgi:hypothetical protein